MGLFGLFKTRTRNEKLWDEANEYNCNKKLADPTLSESSREYYTNLKNDKKYGQKMQKMMNDVLGKDNPFREF